jgi:hypothetical protein
MNIPRTICLSRRAPFDHSDIVPLAVGFDREGEAGDAAADDQDRDARVGVSLQGCLHNCWTGHQLDW